MRKTMIGLAMALALAATPALAEGVAWVDLDKVMELTAKGKETMQKLAAMKDDLELKVRQKEMDLKKAYEELATQKDVLAEDVRKTKEEEFQKGMMEYQKMTVELPQKFEEYRVKLLRSFIGDLEAVTQDVAKAEGKSVVMLKARDYATMSSVVLYGDASADLTDKIVKKLNSGS
ncbi:OmpH family outer membrane protein [bacterium]|nr:OmpH family outer membrane protein [bacterium]